MSIFSQQKRKKGKHPRWNHKNYHQKRKLIKKRKILRRSGWKLNYPEIFILIEDFPYIIRRDKENKLS